MKNVLRERIDFTCVILFALLIGYVCWFYVPWGPTVPVEVKPKVYLITLIDGEIAATYGPILDYDNCIFVKEEFEDRVKEQQEKAQTDQSLANIKDIKVENFCMITKVRPLVK